MLSSFFKQLDYIILTNKIDIRIISLIYNDIC
jgi:hypothetical protein